VRARYRTEGWGRGRLTRRSVARVVTGRERADRKIVDRFAGCVSEPRGGLEGGLWAFVVVGRLAGERGAHAATTEATVAHATAAHPGVCVDLVDLGDLLDHPALDRLDRHRRDATARAGTAERDGHFARLA